MLQFAAGCDSKEFKNINFGTFSECKSLQEIVIPENVESIGNDAFSKCTGLQSVIFRGNAPEINHKIPLYYREDYKGVKPFSGVTATAYYPSGNQTYTNEVKWAYGSELRWKAQEASELAAFTDVNSGDWYYEAAGFVSSRGIMTGMNPSEFGPSVKLSRAQFATILYRMESEP